MSAYIVDPRTIDYLVAWAHRHRHDHGATQTRRGLWRTLAEVPEQFQTAVHGSEPTDPHSQGYGLRLQCVTSNDLGALLLRENARSVGYRYDNLSADDLPGPCDQSRVWRYRFRPVDASLLRPDWVLMQCRCVEYQSCEAPDWQQTPAHAVLEAIRADAIDVITEGAPWGIEDADLARLEAETRAARAGSA